MSYGYIRKIYSSRGIEQACGENIKFMYLLEGHRAPDHNTIARFRKDRLGESMKGLFGQLIEMLVEAGEIDLSTVYIEGRKIEAQAKYREDSVSHPGPRPPPVFPAHVFQCGTHSALSIVNDAFF